MSVIFSFTRMPVTHSLPSIFIPHILFSSLFPPFISPSHHHPLTPFLLPFTFLLSSPFPSLFLYFFHLFPPSYPFISISLSSLHHSLILTFLSFILSLLPILPSLSFLHSFPLPSLFLLYFHLFPPSHPFISISLSSLHHSYLPFLHLFFSTSLPPSLLPSLSPTYTYTSLLVSHTNLRRLADPTNTKGVNTIYIIIIHESWEIIFF